jgi:hypothetical protein
MNVDMEQTCSRIGPYLFERCQDLPVSQTRRNVFPLGELAEKTGTSVRMLGKLRKGYKRALAQSMTPGRNPEFEVSEQSYFGRAAIAVRRI